MADGGCTGGDVVTWDVDKEITSLPVLACPTLEAERISDKKSAEIKETNCFGQFNADDGTGPIAGA